LVGIISTVASVVADLIFNQLPFDKVMSGNFGQAALGNALKGLSPVSILAGFVTSSLTGSPTLSVSIGLPFLGGSISYTPTPDAGSPNTVFGGNLPFFKVDSTRAGQVSGIPVTL